MARIRVLVVEDSITVRQHLIEVLAADAEIEVAGEAENGKRAIQLCGELKPDVVTLDMVLPEMSGLAAAEYIMAHSPTPILIVSSSINRGELFRAYDALAAGAVDVLEKPNGSESDGRWEERFLSAVKMVSRIKVITHPRARLGRSRPASVPLTDFPPMEHPGCKAVAVGASTGGPAAISEILRSLPAPYLIPILLVVHIDEPFGSAFADWLDGLTAHRVSYACDREPLASVAGRVVMAPPNKHLVIRQGKLHLSSGPQRHSCRPSVDVLFESVSRELGAAGVGCLLTGMGRDGAAGLLEIRRSGGLTLAQDEATSVVYGMPREAVLQGAAERVLPLTEIAGALASLVGGIRSRRAS